MSGNNNEKDHALIREDTLHRIRTASTLTISPELFEKLYLSPQNPVKGELRATFANPTPVLVVVLICCHQATIIFGPADYS